MQQKRVRSHKPKPDGPKQGGHKASRADDPAGLGAGVLAQGVNVHDSVVLAELLVAVVPVKGKRGGSRQRPSKLHTDKAYDRPSD